MGLSRFTVRLLTGLMTVALGGIIFLQYRVLDGNLKLKEEAFGRNAVSALNYATERLEEIDARERLFSETGDSVGVLAVHLGKHREEGTASEGDSVFLLSVVTSGSAGLATNFNGEQLSYELGTPQHVAVKIFDVLGRLDTTVIDERKGAGKYQLMLPMERLGKGVFFVRVETDSGTSTLQWDRSGGWTQAYTDDAGRTRRIVKRVTETVTSGDSRSLGERFSTDLVDSLITEGLVRSGIHLPYDFAVRDLSCDSLVMQRTTPGAQGDFQYSAVLFPVGFTGTPGELLLRFPEYRSFLIRSLLPELIVNIVLIGMVIACFGYAIRMLLRQREFAGRLSEFINNMTHEFKTPLSTIALSAEAIARADVASDPRRVETYNTIISDEQKRMKSQVDRILQMAALEEGELEFRLTDLDLHQLIRTAVVNFSLRAEERGGRIATSLLAEKTTFMGDAVHIGNVIHNLLDNAMKYSPDAPVIEIRTRNEGGSLVMSVSDEGIGIAHDQLEKVFEKYYRVPTQNLHDVKGFGLGLSYVRLVVEKHDGKVCAISSGGKGTTIELSLPLSDG